MTIAQHFQDFLLALFNFIQSMQKFADTTNVGVKNVFDVGLSSKCELKYTPAKLSWCTRPWYPSEGTRSKISSIRFSSLQSRICLCDVMLFKFFHLDNGKDTCILWLAFWLFSQLHWPSRISSPIVFCILFWPLIHI